MTVTKKQTSIAIFAVVFATAMIVGTLASATSDNMAFAKKQSIAQSNSNTQSSVCNSPGGSASGFGFLAGFASGGTGGSPLVSCNNFNANTNPQQGSNS